MDIEKAKRLVGKVTAEQLRFVDCFVAEKIALFMPSCGACFYALTPLHSHPAYMFVLSFDAKTVIVINGKELHSKPGKLFALSPDIVHHELPSDFPPRYIAILIEREFFEERINDYAMRNNFSFSGDFYEPCPGLLSLLKRFMAEASAGLPGSQDVLQALGTEICHAIIRSIFHIARPVDIVTSRFDIDRAVEYLHSHLAEKLTLKDMAQVATMSSSHFSRVFKKEIGASPSDYLSRIRLERARRLLMSGGRSITDIALECGFGSAAYFSDKFSKKYGITPSEFRESLAKGIISKEDSKITNDSMSTRSA